MARFAHLPMLGFAEPNDHLETGEEPMKFKYLLSAAVALSAFASDAAVAQQRVKVPITNKEWEQPFPAFKIVGNLYYVGTYDLGCYLIDTGAGLILVNSGAPGSYPHQGEHRSARLQDERHQGHHLDARAF